MEELKPLLKAEPQATQFGELGKTGLKRWGGKVYEEFLMELKGERAFKVYREMRDNDPTIGAILFAIEMLCRQVNWYMAPATQDAADVEDAQFVDQCRNDLNQSWSSLIAEVMRTMLPNGFSPHELVYKKRDGKNSKYNDQLIGWKKIAVRAPETIDQWSFDEFGDLLGMVQKAPPHYMPVVIEKEKFVLFRTTEDKGNPEGRSVLRNAYRPWYFKKHIETIEGIGIERDLAGLPVFYVPAELLASEDPKAKEVVAELRNIVTQVRQDEQAGLVLPQSYDDKGNAMYKFELLSAPNSKQFDTDKVVQRYDQRMAMVVLADFILLGHEKVGSFALASSKTNIFSVAIGAWLDSVCSVFNDDAIPKLMKLNGKLDGPYPVLHHGDIEQTDLAELGAYLQSLSSSGMPLFPDPALQAHLLKLAGLPVPEESA